MAKPLKKNSLEAQLAEMQALLVERDQKLAEWDAGPEGKKLQAAREASQRADEKLDAVREAFYARRKKVGFALGVWTEDGDPTRALFDRVRAHVGLGLRESLDLMPQMNSFRGGRESGERMLQHAANDLASMLINRDPEVAKLNKEIDRLRDVFTKARESERNAEEPRNHIRSSGGRYWRLESRIREIEDRIKARDLKSPPLDPDPTLAAAERARRADNVDRLRKIRDELATLAEWARGKPEAKPSKPFTWEKP